MSPEEIVSGAFEVFRTDIESPPPLTLRGGNAVDGYSQAVPFDPAEDEPTDAYFEAFAFWGLGYLDARSWRHYLPRLIDYAFRHPNDPAMVAEALVRSLRPVIPEESRRVQTWGGYLCGDAHTIVAVNLTPLDMRSLADSVRMRSTLFRDTVSPRSIVVPGSRHAERLEGLAHGDSPAEPQMLAMIFAIAGAELATLSIRSWPREDLVREVERILGSFEITGS